MAAAWALLLERGLTALPVVDRSGRPVGTVFRGDLAAAVLEDEPTHPGALPAGRPSGSSATGPSFRRPPSTTPLSFVRDVMRPEFTTVEEGTPLAEARSRLLASGAAQLVIVDARGVMVGALSAHDLEP